MSSLTTPNISWASNLYSWLRNGSPVEELGGDIEHGLEDHLSTQDTQDISQSPKAKEMCSLEEITEPMHLELGEDRLAIREKQKKELKNRIEKLEMSHFKRQVGISCGLFVPSVVSTVASGIAMVVLKGGLGTIIPFSVSVGVVGLSWGWMFLDRVSFVNKLESIEGQLKKLDAEEKLNVVINHLANERFQQMVSNAEAKQ